MPSFKHLIIYLFAVILLGSCIKDLLEDDEPNIKITAKINGEDFTTNEITGADVATVTIVSDTLINWYVFAFAGTHFSSLTPPSSKNISIVIQDENFDDLISGSTFGSQNATGFYVHQIDGESVIDSESTSTGDATVSITAIDKDAKIFSGAFSFTAIDTLSGISYAITNGIFTDLPYTIE